MQPFRIEDLWLHRALAALAAPASDGCLVFQLTRPHRGLDRNRSILWALDPARRRPRLLTAPLLDATSPAVSPDGTSLAFLSKGGADDGELKVFCLRLDDRRPRCVGGVKGFTLESLVMWSQDGGSVLVLASEAFAEDALDDTSCPVRPHVLTHLPAKLDGSGFTAGKRTRLVQLAIGSGRSNVLVGGDFEVREARWSPDGQQLAWVQGGQGSQRHRMAIWVAEADGSRARPVTEPMASINGLSWSPDGGRIAFGGNDIDGDSLAHLWCLGLNDRSLGRPVGDDLHLEGSRIVWNADGCRLATVASREGLQEIVVVDLESASVQPHASGLRHVNELCSLGDRLFYTAASMQSPVEIFSASWDGGDEVRHTSFNSGWVGRRRQPRVSKRRFDVVDGDGRQGQIDAWVLLPAEGEGPFPLLMDFHGGPQSAVMVDLPGHFYWYLLCAQGWAVVAANAVGSTGYGDDFARRLRGRWGELDFPQHLGVLDALQAEKIADDRVACTGKSYGGYLAAWAIGCCERFRAAVVSAPVANIESHAGTSDTGWYVTPYAMAGEQSDRRQHNVALSPVTWCRNVSAATLLLQGDADQRCPLGQSEELFAALIRCRRAPVRMVVYPGGSHGLASTGRPSHRVDYHRRIAGWLGDWIGES